MAKTLHSKRHRRLAELLTERRKQAGLTQAAVARALGRHQPFIANIENGDRRLDVVEFLVLAEIIGFDPYEVMREIASIKPE
ncbi:helix-turn-helix transcriptional regulator [Mesorhizobium sp. WSM2561]|uniref:helix-turn-helix domain-containing protein n=1 Tax=Mesorhizobium sp. WSM2561 TaxID=1040985 RepID=UPI000A01E8A8|nr:helix-turn-helix transcriptional regulator [Mesorhizobium sp. WSM2561]